MCFRKNLLLFVYLCDDKQIFKDMDKDIKTLLDKLAAYTDTTDKILQHYTHKAQTPLQKTVTAYHEIGHALATLYTGLSLTRIEVYDDIVDNKVLGRCFHGKPPRRPGVRDIKTPNGKRRFMINGAVSLGGIIATNLYFNESAPLLVSNPEQDDQTEYNYMCYLSQKGISTDPADDPEHQELIGRYTDELDAELSALFTRHASTFQQCARMVVKNGVLSGDDITRIYKANGGDIWTKYNNHKTL